MPHLEPTALEEAVNPGIVTVLQDVFEAQEVVQGRAGHQLHGRALRVQRSRGGTPA